MGGDTTIGTPGEPAEWAAILARIDFITRELWELRRLIARLLPSESPTLTSHLLGCLGPEPIEAYDDELDWGRFTDR